MAASRRSQIKPRTHWRAIDCPAWVDGNEALLVLREKDNAVFCMRGPDALAAYEQGILHGWTPLARATLFHRGEGRSDG